MLYMGNSMMGNRGADVVHGKHITLGNRGADVIHGKHITLGNRGADVIHGRCRCYTWETYYTG